jgi:hypothetical protein
VSNHGQLKDPVAEAGGRKKERQTDRKKGKLCSKSNVDRGILLAHSPCLPTPCWRTHDHILTRLEGVWKGLLLNGVETAMGAKNMLKQLRIGF